MDLYYKVSKSSLLGKQFNSVMDKLDAFNKKAKIICDKYDILQMYHINWDFCGVYTCHFKETPNRTEWKKVDDGYMPKKRCKNKELLNDFKQLKELSVSWDEINSLFGIDDIFFHVGFKIFEDCIVFIVDTEHDILNKDAKQISNLDYLNMLNNL